MRHRPSISRRSAVQLLAGAAAVAPEFAAAAGSTPSLGALAASRGLLFGASFASHELDQPTGIQYAKMYVADARIVTTELELKLATLRPQPGPIDFSPADRFFAFARGADLQVRGHTLIWDDYVPEWIKQLTKLETERLLETHITAVMTRYKGRVRSWDVVNEPIAPWDDTPGKLRAGPFYRALGADYIAKSFRIARALDAKARLVLNEAATERYDDYGRAFRENFSVLVDKLLSAGVPIDAIGLQCHLIPSKPIDIDAYCRYIERFSRAGLEIHLTELDVDDAAYPGSIAERDAKVADLYYRFLSAVLRNPRVTEVVTWQIGDRHSWYRGVSLANKTRAPRPLLYDDAYARKPAWHAVARALAGMPKR